MAGPNLLKALVLIFFPVWSFRWIQLGETPSFPGRNHNHTGKEKAYPDCCVYPEISPRWAKPTLHKCP